MNGRAITCPDGRRPAVARATDIGMLWRSGVLGAVLLALAGCPAATTSAMPQPSATAAISVGCPPPATAPLGDTKALDLACLTTPSVRVPIGALAGRPEVINVWASWCGPCRQEMPMLESAHLAYGDQVLFIGVDSRDERGAALRFLANVGVTYPQVFDANARFAASIGTMGIPYTVIVDASGSIVYRQFGTTTTQMLKTALDDAAGVTAAAFDPGARRSPRDSRPPPIVRLCCAAPRCPPTGIVDLVERDCTVGQRGVA
jgi:cytochrome c biogenesis protein CcmG, thiol:disulfide interchange protein DsbE